MPITVRDAMSTDLVATARKTSLADAERMLLSYGVDELFVVDERGWLCGVVPDYELLKARMAPSLELRTVEAVMSRRFLVIEPDSPLTLAGRYLREHVHRRLVVVEERRLLGQITRRSVLAWLRAMPERESDEFLRGETEHEMLRRLDEMHPPMLLRRETARIASSPLPSRIRETSTRSA
jgi:CBS domain-containing protein